MSELVDFSTPKPDTWVTLGGKTKAGETNPTSINGYYLGAAVGPDPFNEGKVKTTLILQTPQGIAGVNGNTDLVAKMKESEINMLRKGYTAVGSFVVLTCVGERAPTKKGRSPTKLFKIQFDPNDTKAVSAAGESLSAETTDDYDRGEADEDAYESAVDNSDYAAEEAAQTAALAALERKQKVEAMLKGKTKTSPRN